MAGSKKAASKSAAKKSATTRKSSGAGSTAKNKAGAASLQQSATSVPQGARPQQNPIQVETTPTGHAGQQLGDAPAVGPDADQLRKLGRGIGKSLDQLLVDGMTVSKTGGRVKIRMPRSTGGFADYEGTDFAQAYDGLHDDLAGNPARIDTGTDPAKEAKRKAELEQQISDAREAPESVIPELRGKRTRGE